MFPSLSFLPLVLLSLLILTLSHSSPPLNMCEYREDKACCYFHPKEVIIGVCHLCLNERLLILAAKQGHILSQSKGTKSYRSHRVAQRNSHKTLPKIFAIGSFLNPLKFKHKKFDDSNLDSSTSPEDSFISIKFENNGATTWEKSKVSKVSLDHCNNMTWNHSLTNKEANKSVVEHAKPRGSLRWQKRIGHLFQHNRWRRSSSSKKNVCHVSSKLEGVKVRSGWIRSLTKRRTKE